MLRWWARDLAREPDLLVHDVAPGHGSLSSDDEELRRLQREVHRLQQENSFLEGAAHFATESR